MESIERGFRPKQFGVECSIAGCAEWCVSRDLCAKHRMQLYRKTVKSKAYTKEYNKRYKRKDINKLCVHCQKPFVTARRSQELCSVCSVKYGGYLAQVECRAKCPEKHKARDIVNKRIKRGVSLSKAPCVVCGSTRAIHAHHKDYSKPLDITWLCRKHHREVHIKSIQLDVM